MPTVQGCVLIVDDDEDLRKAMGDVVELWTVGGGHDDSIATPSAWAEALTWISDRFARTAAVSTCSIS